MFIRVGILVDATKSNTSSGILMGCDELPGIIFCVLVANDFGKMLSSGCAVMCARVERNFETCVSDVGVIIGVDVMCSGSVIEAG